MNAGGPIRLPLDPRQVSADDQPTAGLILSLEQ